VLQIFLRAFERFVRALQILLRAFALPLRSLQVVLCAFALTLGTLQIFLRALMIRLRDLEILLRSFAVGLCALQFLLGPLALAICTLQLVVCRLPIGLCALAVGVGAFEIGLCALKIDLRTLTLRVGAFEIRLGPGAFGCDRFFEFTPRLRRGLLCLSARPCNRLGKRALDFRTRRGNFGGEARIPLRVNGVQFRGPPLFRIGVGALPGFVQCLFMALREMAQVSVELGLEFGANAVDDTANLFLGH